MPPAYRDDMAARYRPMFLAMIIFMTSLVPP